jgi:hypothetical protein
VRVGRFHYRLSATEDQRGIDALRQIVDNPGDLYLYLTYLPLLLPVRYQNHHRLAQAAPEHHLQTNQPHVYQAELRAESGYAFLITKATTVTKRCRPPRRWTDKPTVTVTPYKYQLIKLDLRLNCHYLTKSLRFLNNKKLNSTGSPAAVGVDVNTCREWRNTVCHPCQGNWIERPNRAPRPQISNGFWRLFPSS